MAGKKQAPQKFEEPDEAEGWEDAVVEADGKETEAEADARLRDWRDVERYREMKELRRLVDDDYGLEDIFHIPLKPRPEPVIPPRLPKGAAAKILPKLAPAAPNARNDSKAHAKAAPAKVAAKAAPKAHARPPARAKAPAKLKAKAKRR